MIASGVYSHSAHSFFEYKTGEYKADKYGYLFSDSKLEQKYSSFEIRGSKLVTLQRWITEGDWDEDAFCEEYAIGDDMPEILRLLDEILIEPD